MPEKNKFAPDPSANGSSSERIRRDRAAVRRTVLLVVLAAVLVVLSLVWLQSNRWQTPSLGPVYEVVRSRRITAAPDEPSPSLSDPDQTLLPARVEPRRGVTLVKLRVVDSLGVPIESGSVAWRWSHGDSVHSEGRVQNDEGALERVRPIDGVLTVFEFPSHVGSALFTVAASGCWPRNAHVAELRHVRGFRQPHDAVVEHEVTLQLTSAPDGSCVHGAVKLDGEPKCPPGLRIVLEQGRGGERRVAAIDKEQARYTLVDCTSAAKGLWVESQVTAPFFVPIEVLNRRAIAGRYDLELSTAPTTTVRVVDGRTGHLLSGVRVVLGLVIPMESDRTTFTHEFELTADPDGLFRTRQLGQRGTVRARILDQEEQPIHSETVQLEKLAVPDVIELLVRPRSERYAKIWGYTADLERLTDGGESRSPLRVVGRYRAADGGHQSVAAGLESGRWGLFVPRDAAFDVWAERASDREVVSQLATDVATHAREATPIVLEPRREETLLIAYRAAPHGARATLRWRNSNRSVSEPLDLPTSGDGAVKCTWRGEPTLECELSKPEQWEVQRSWSAPKSGQELEIELAGDAPTRWHVTAQGEPVRGGSTIRLFRVDGDDAVAGLAWLDSEGVSPFLPLPRGRYFYSIQEQGTSRMVCGIASTEPNGRAVDVRIDWRGDPLAPPLSERGTSAVAFEIVACEGLSLIERVPQMGRTFPLPARSSNPSGTDPVLVDAANCRLEWRY